MFFFSADQFLGLSRRFPFPPDVPLTLSLPPFSPSDLRRRRFTCHIDLHPSPLFWQCWIYKERRPLAVFERGEKMTAATLKASSSTELMKSEGNDTVDTIIKQTIGKDPLLSFSRAMDSPAQWIQLLHALDQQELQGWPFPSLKVQMQNCDKCSREFCSPINYKRHICVHHRLKKLAKLYLEEAKEVLSFKNVIFEGVPGSSIVKSLTTLVRRPGVATLPQVYLRAGSALLDVIHARPSRFPLSSSELFCILDDASEKTFLCGTADLMQKYVFHGEAGKSGLETKNLVACTSFLLEQKLVKAWLADKDAEALRCQKLLVEEEEAAQKRKAKLLERKRKKKLRQKEHKAKELKHVEADVNECISNTLEAPKMPAETSSPSATCDSGMPVPEMLPDQVHLSSEPFELSNSDEEAGPDSRSGYGCDCTSQNVERQTMPGSGRRHGVVVRCQLPPKSQRGVPSGFHSGQNSQASKLGAMQKLGIHRDLRTSPVANTNKVWSRKPKPESGGEVLKARVQEEEINRQEQSKTNEVLIGSICVTLGNCSQEGNNLARAGEDNLSEHQIPKKADIQEKSAKTDSLQSGTNRSTIKLWRPVSQCGRKGPMSVQNGNIESEADANAEKDNDQNPEEVCLRCYATVDDGNGGGKYSNKFLEGSVYPGSAIHAAKVFLAQKWKKAIAAHHVKLVLSPCSEPPGYPETGCGVAIQSSNFHKMQHSWHCKQLVG
ncbi:hypothetical protein F2P56_031486 [Juglans regia]|uniref:Uncharacterized protein LOC108982674 isoform X3 n=2 Tax=Juglans regia TaxID=51240 RepID=A0A2I4DR88_JUGRE|nr:uncharacterized protein LOC108982674 isoform X3 [Juglans regia]KAF5451207.1 hypothetical protein F2P56_031486 [Juglans regia]